MNPYKKCPVYENEAYLLRLVEPSDAPDLRSDYENEERICQILSLIVPPAFELFGCGMVATKIPPYALCRKAAAESFGFQASSEKLIGGDDKKEYTDYYVQLTSHTS